MKQSVICHNYGVRLRTRSGLGLGVKAIWSGLGLGVKEFWDLSK